MRIIRHGLGVIGLSGAIALSAGVVLNVTKAHAQPVPLYLTCTGTNSDMTSAPGSALTTCEVHAVVPNLIAGVYATKLTGPTTSQIISCGPTIAVTTAAGQPQGNACVYTVTAATVAPNDLIGKETIFIALGTTGKSVTHQGYECGPPNPLITCPPPTGYQDVSTIGNGSCVGAGQMVSPLGGCAALPAPPGGTPTPSNPTPTPHTPTPTSTSTGSDNDSNSAVTKTTQATVASGVKSLSNTSAPAHPFAPILFALVALFVAITLAGGLGLYRLRRQRQDKDSG